jgi:hypothetical protein
VKKSAFILLLLGSQCSASASEIPKDNPEHISYVIKQGENLSFIASKYLEGDQALNILLRLNDKNKPNSIPVGEKILLPKSLLKYSSSTATVSKLNCSNAFLVNNNPQQIEIGSVLNQDDIIKVPAGCQVGVTLEDGSNINLVSGSVLKFKTLRTSAMEKSPQVDFELMNGRVDVEVVKRAKGDASFEIHTPKALAGVRGTQFRVGFDEQKNTSQVEVKTGVVAAKGEANDAPASELQFVKKLPRAKEPKPVPRLLKKCLLVANWASCWMASCMILFMTLVHYSSSFCFWQINNPNDNG